ncbi:MAG: hypothetical protein HZB42_15930 [Sphingobacteriales bacterium]|nr:hypothetical protein [Sphingobacteriales bacterium]
MTLVLLTCIHCCAFSQQSPYAFSLRSDSIDIQVSQAQGHISDLKLFDQGKIAVYMDFYFKEDLVRSANAYIIVRDSNNRIIDSSKTEAWDLQGANKNHFKWRYKRMELEIASEKGSFSVTSNLDDGNHKLNLEYLFEKDAMYWVQVQNQSRRFMDTVEKYNDKFVSFETTLDHLKLAGKHESHGMFWIEGYVVYELSPKKIKKLQGKKVRISGKVYYRIGYGSPNYKFTYGNTGNQVHAQTRGIDAKEIFKPKIEIIK